MDINARTVKALGEDVIKQLGSLQFCIVGCGGTGANFAEMLVRTGATRLILIDGSKVDETDLNRVFSFSGNDIGNSKVKILKDRLDSICPDLKICTRHDSFRKPEDILDNYSMGQRVRDAVHDADVVFIGTDTNTSRLAIEELCKDKDSGMLLSCGVLVDRGAGVYEFECVWSPETPDEKEKAEGYGPENASFASIVHEATSVAFTMLLSHLKDENSDFKSYRKTYGANLRPDEVFINEKANGNRP